MGEGIQSPLGPLVAGRECGECVACCQIPGIHVPELHKPAGVLCQHSTGAACGIYETRPKLCRGYFCAWRHIAVLPDRTRPDRLGVMFSLENQRPPQHIFENLYIVGRPTGDVDAFDKPDVGRILAMFGSDIFPVFITWQDKIRLIYPEAPLAEAICDLAAVTDPALKAKADQWLRDYAPYARFSVGDDAVVLPPGY